MSQLEYPKYRIKRSFKLKTLQLNDPVIFFIDKTAIH